MSHFKTVTNTKCARKKSLFRTQNYKYQFSMERNSLKGHPSEGVTFQIEGVSWGVS